MQIGTTQRWQEIRELWQQHQWLYTVAGFLIGVLVTPLILLIREDMLGFMGSLVPEAVGIAFTVLFINALDKQRESIRRKVELQERLVRDAGSPVLSTAVNAIRELRAMGWLEGDDGLLKGKNLWRAHLREVNLSGANLANAILDEARLADAKMINTNLSGTGMAQARLERADLSLATLTNTYLANTELEYAILTEANLEDAILSEANLHFAELTLARLINTDLSLANLPHAVLSSADLTGANLENADLSNADLFSTNLTNATLIRANLSGADLTGADLTGANFSYAHLDGGTCLPDGHYWSPDTDLSAYGAIIDPGAKHATETVAGVSLGESPAQTAPMRNPLADFSPNMDETQEIHIIGGGQLLDEIMSPVVAEDLSDLPDLDWPEDIDPGLFDDFFGDEDDDADESSEEGTVGKVYVTEFGAKIFGDDFIPDEVDVWEFEAIDADSTAEQQEFHDEVLSQELEAETGDDVHDDDDGSGDEDNLHKTMEDD